MIRIDSKLLVGLALVLAGCGGESVALMGGAPEGSDDAKQAEAWAAQDNPSLFSSTLEMRFASLPTSGQAANIPWAGSYWPTYEDNINYKWAGASSDSAAKKYERAFGGTNVEDAVSRNHGIESVSKTCTADSACDSSMGEVCAKRTGQTSGRCVATWWGICHAWTPAAILFPEPKNPVTRNGITFQVQDLKGLASLVHNSTQTKFVSLRCNKMNGQADGGGIRLDSYGRPIDADRECRDTNAGTYHVLLANYLGLMRQAFAEDRIAGYEVWNQPIRGFRVISQNEVSAAQANALVGVSGPDAGTYAFNSAAQRFISVRAAVQYIGESAAETGYTGNSIDSYTHTDTYDYVLELDAAGKIVGGEWVGSSKLSHPDFLWLPIGPGVTSVAGGAIKYDVVKAMVMESAGQVPASDGGVAAQVTVQESATLAQGEWKHFGPYPTSTGPITVTMTGTGDADLYTRLSGQPSLNLYDCRPYAGTANETCQAAGPGAFYVSVNGYSASTVQLTITYAGQRPADGGVLVTDAGIRPDAGTDAGIRPDAGTDAGIRPDAGTDAGIRPDAGGIITPTDAGVAHLNVSGSVALGEMKVFTETVVAGRPVTVRTTAPNDIDLYLKFGAAPTNTVFDQRGYTASGNETQTFVPTASGTLFIGVHGYAASTFTLTTADQ